jgi:hypothetical protein
MADLVMVHRSTTEEECLLNRDHILHARRSPNGEYTIVKFINNDENLTIVEDLHFLKTD